MTLEWIEQAPGKWFLARGSSDTYLIAQDDQGIALARYPADAVPVAAARQAALTAIRVDGAYDVVPAAAVVLIAHLKQAAQAYESGTGMSGIGSHPAWRH